MSHVVNGKKIADNVSHLEYTEPFQILYERWLKKFAGDLASSQDKHTIKSNISKG